MYIIVVMLTIDGKFIESTAVLGKDHKDATILADPIAIKMASDNGIDMDEEMTDHLITEGKAMDLEKRVDVTVFHPDVMPTPYVEASNRH